jgi:hypothetical protein
MANGQHSADAAVGSRIGPELCFVSISANVQSLTFPCDSAGRVDLDALSENKRNDYFFARALMGRDYAFPVVAPVGTA